MRTRLTWCAAAGLALLALGMGRKPPAKEDAKMTDLSQMTAVDVTPNAWTGAYCAATTPSAQLIEDEKSWAELWKQSLNKEAPAVDFGKFVAAAVFVGVRNTGGYGVDFLPPVSDGAAAVIGYTVRSPGKSSFVIQSFTQPYAIRLYRKPGTPVRLEEAK
ncbi:MAG: protease complex subunit PrcB family protein [Elusimicrobiota bacterium]